MLKRLTVVIDNHDGEVAAAGPAKYHVTVAFGDVLGLIAAPVSVARSIGVRRSLSAPIEPPDRAPSVVYVLWEVSCDRDQGKRAIRLDVDPALFAGEVRLTVRWSTLRVLDEGYEIVSLAVDERAAAPVRALPPGAGRLLLDSIDALIRARR